MIPGDRVTVENHGIGYIVEVMSNGTAVVDMKDGSTPRSWSAKRIKLVRSERAPRGLARITPRGEQAARLRDQGMKRRDIAMLMGMNECSVHALLAKVDEARQDERNLRHMR
jgi:hypothetical protein